MAAVPAPAPDADHEVVWGARMPAATAARFRAMLPLLLNREDTDDTTAALCTALEALAAEGCTVAAGILGMLLHRQSAWRGAHAGR